MSIPRLALFGIAVIARLTCGQTQAADITGTGPDRLTGIFQKWGETYRDADGAGVVQYQAGLPTEIIKEVKAGIVDFAGSDSPLSDDVLAGADLVQFPVIFDGVAIVTNVPGILSGALHLDSETLAQIYLGEIDAWDDHRIRALNPGVALPPLPIVPVHRTGSSGTTAAFTQYLSGSSATWRERVGHHVSVAFPVGPGGRGDDGVLLNVQQIKGAIGYAQFAHAKYTLLALAAMRNRDGAFVTPGDRAFREAITGASDPDEGCPIFFNNQPGPQSWPIMVANFVIMNRRQARIEHGRTVLHFFEWIYRHGAPIADDLDYVSTPTDAVRFVQATWTTFIDPEGNRLWSH